MAVMGSTSSTGDRALNRLRVRTQTCTSRASESRRTHHVGLLLSASSTMQLDPEPTG